MIEKKDIIIIINIKNAFKFIIFILEHLEMNMGRLLDVLKVC